MADRDAAPPACPGPDPHPRAPRAFTVPAGAVDTHAHVIGVPPAHPFVAQRSYTPPEASPAAYVRMLDATGMARGVLVQVSVHGTHNALLLETVRAHRDRLRGVAVMPLGLPERAYVDARDAGVVALRLNVLYGGGIGFEQVEAYAALAREMGWHLEFLIDVRTLAPIASRLARLAVPFVVDHMGHFAVDEVAVDAPAFRTLVALVRDGAWVKLSGAYRLSKREPSYDDTVPYAHALVAAAPSRCVWGSDWPHVAHWARMPNVGELLDVFAQWVPDAAQRQRVLVDNAHALYGF